jgi:hypothetical protein
MSDKMKIKINRIIKVRSWTSFIDGEASPKCKEALKL